jgi:hypothetical protein
MNDTIFVVSRRVAADGSKVDWPDKNWPGSCETILRTLYKVNYEKLEIQLDGESGPIIKNSELPDKAGFYKRL